MDCKNCGEKIKSGVNKRQRFCSIPCCNVFTKRKHGMTGSRFYNIWQLANRRCKKMDSEKYGYYGGRGIKVLWANFAEFQRDMFEEYEAHVGKYGEQNTTLERIDNAGNYCKANCRWATIKEQARNRRTRRDVKAFGETMSVTEWAEKMRMPRHKLWLRLFRYKMRPEDALLKP